MSTALRLALVSAFPPGRQSLNEYGLHLARELAQRDDVAEVIVIADTLSEPAAELDLGPKVRVSRVWDFNSLAAMPKILRALRRAAPDGAIWNLQTATFGDREMPAALGLLAPAAARLMGCPSGIIAHNIVAGIDLDSTQLKGQKLRQMLVRAGGAVITRAMLAADYMTVTLKSYRDILAAAHPRAKVHLVPHGTFDTQARAIAPVAQRPRRIVTMGKFGTYKRLETLLAAFDILRRDPRYARYELVIGGSDHPNTLGYVAGLAAARANDPDVRFQGNVAEDDIPAFFGDARASVFDYSATTGSSGVLHQTASYGAVPVFPHIGDFVDVSRDEGLNGVNYQPNDAEDMARALAAILSDTARAQALAEGNRAASLDIPLSAIAAFHVERLTRVSMPPPRGREATA
ncbi:MAG: glycosyltransferase [Roseivivax sp.]|nr:glycosyltransferase [Roseivivax sp.]